jgi:hypothetical protein
MEATPKAGTPVNPEEAKAITGGADEGDCLAPTSADQPAGGDSPWWRVLQDALGNLMR